MNIPLSILDRGLFIYDEMVLNKANHIKDSQLFGNCWLAYGRAVTQNAVFIR